MNTTLSNEWKKEILFDSFTSSKIKTALSKIKFDPYIEYEAYQGILKNVLYSIVPYGNYLELKKITEKQNGNCATLIRGLPVSFSDLVPTPRFDGSINGKDLLSEMLLLSFASLINLKPFLNKDEKDGQIIQQVIPMHGQEFTESGLGSSIGFPWHTENASFVETTKFFFLFCLRGNPMAYTTLFPIDDLIGQLSPLVVDLLKEPNFIHRTGPSFNRKLEIIAPILTEDGPFLKLRLNLASGRTSVKDDSPLAKLALQEVIRVVNNSSDTKKICLEPGDLLAIHNERTMHGRTAFVMHINPDERRWLQRLYCTYF